jgi:rubrerythrin
MTCKDCVHYEVCEEIESLPQRKDFIWYRAESGCPHFKNKANLVELKQGEWIKSIHKETPIIKDGRLFEKEHEVFCCSVCGVKIVGLRNMSFCPFCGAKMDLQGGAKE